MARVRSFFVLGALSIGACTPPVAPRARAPHAVVVVPPAARSMSARERAKAALIDLDAHAWTVAAILVAEELPPVEKLGLAPAPPSAPVPPPPPVSPTPAVGSPKTGKPLALTFMHDDVVVSRMLGPDRQTRLAETLIVQKVAPCFTSGADVWTGELRVLPNGELQLVTRADDRLGTCAAGRMRSLVVDPPSGGGRGWRLVLRARPVGTSKPATREWLAEDHEGEVRELDVLATTPDAPERDRARLMLGTRHMEAALASPDAQAARMAQAQAAFAPLLVAPGTDALLRAHAAMRSAWVHAQVIPSPVRALRAFVCGEAAAGAPFPDDHSEPYWRAWEALHLTPIGMRTPPKASPMKPVPPTADAPRTRDEATEYRSPYDACTATSNEPWSAEIWLALGRFHELWDGAGGPFALNRAESAYRRAVDGARGVWPLEGHARSALAEVLFREQRYREAVSELVRVLDDDEAAGRAAVPELRRRALQVFATALTYLDFDGPRASEPYVAREDILDTEPNQAVANKKIGAAALERVESAAILPHDRHWTADVLRWLAHELVVLYAYEQAAMAYETFLRRWPLHRDAPVVQAEIARVFETSAMTLRPGTPDHVDALRRGREARLRLTRYSGTSAWAIANRADPEALARAENLRAKLAP